MGRYSDINFILNLEIDDGIELIIKAYEEKEKDKAWNMWLVEYNLMAMGMKEFKPFSDYYTKQTKEPTKKKTKKEIIKNVNEIIEMTVG